MSSRSSCISELFDLKHPGDDLRRGSRVRNFQKTRNKGAKISGSTRRHKCEWLTA
jgi:hypothetical protein